MNFEENNDEPKQADFNNLLSIQPRPKRFRAFSAVFITCLFGWLFAYLATNIFKDYSFGLFIWLPFVLGAASTVIYGYKNPVKKKKVFNVSMLTLLTFCFGLLAFAWEGVICLFMAMPIGFVFTFLGHYAGYKFLRYSGNTAAILTLCMLLSVPSLMAFENAEPSSEEVRFVTTSIEINANSEQVWKNVISFPQLKNPEEFIFKTGIAFPINATIAGQGVGAIRRCNFSTGSFIEPITVWDEPHLLRFRVSDQPETMKELNVFATHPTHLHGYWISKQGQFKLISLPNGHTLLEGTTWYVNKIKPASYWSIWSDYIVHKIHRRVLEHIKEQAENK